MNQRVAREELARLRREAARRRSQLPPEPPPPAASAASAEPAWAVPPVVHSVDLDDGRIDADAAKVVWRLIRNGYEAYLVGGCVRDLLLGSAPKDFDVATSARPDDVRALFRNSRIIGRRFRLVHVLFGDGRVIETATFRQSPHDHPANDGEDLLIRRDNVFGDAHEDAARRDFTINGLFYDLERKRVLDWVGGIPDIERRAIHTIGEPVVRFREDPVRILRALRFAARLDLGLTSDVYDAIVQCRTTLQLAARPRLFEEVTRLLRGGGAHRSIWLAWETGVLDVVLPELAAYLADAEDGAPIAWRVLSALDARIAQDGPPDDIVLWAALLLEPMREASAGARDRVAAVGEFLEPIADRLNVPRRIVDALQRVAALLPRLQAGHGGRPARSSFYALATEVHLLYTAACAAWASPDGKLELPALPPGGAAAAPPSRMHAKRRRKRAPGR